MSTTKSYAGSFHAAHPYEGYPDSVFDREAVTETEEPKEEKEYIHLATIQTNDYLERLEEMAKEQEKAILAQYELAKAQALDVKNDAISLSGQAYMKSINPYGTKKEALSSKGFNANGGYSASNDQANYANYINSQNMANENYNDTVTNLEISAIDKQLQNSYYYSDITADMMGDMESIYNQAIKDNEKADEEYKQNIQSALEFVETLYSVSPKKVGADNTELESYISKIYGISEEDFNFIVDSVLNLYGEEYTDEEYDEEDEYFWN